MGLLYLYWRKRHTDWFMHDGIPAFFFVVFLSRRMQAFYTTGVMLGETEKRPYMSALLDGVYCSFNAKSFFIFYFFTFISNQKTMQKVRQFLDACIHSALLDGVYCSLNPLRTRRVCVI
jgi:hypothetical protein